MNKEHKLFIEDMRSVLNDVTPYTETNEKTKK